MTSQKTQVANETSGFPNTSPAAKPKKHESLFSASANWAAHKTFRALLVENLSEAEAQQMLLQIQPKTIQ